MTTLPGYGDFARMLYATGVLSDPWLGGKERFRLWPALLSQSQAERLRTAAERVGQVYHELSEIVIRRPELLDQFFNLTPWQKAMWFASEGRWHGIARVDLFICPDGAEDGCIRACEMNSDTPSGEAEAALLNQLLHHFHPNTIDPNEGFDERFWQMLAASHRARTGQDIEPESIAIVYPTDLPEDLSMIAIYKRWLEERGCKVTLGSPFNLGVDNEGRVTVMGEAVDLIIRHYKTDWWSERETIWTNQAPFADPDPLARELTLLRSELFSEQAQSWIAEYIPETRRLTAMRHEDLSRDEWVLKSDYGCEGDSVLCGPFVKPSDWQLALATAIPEHWIAQRFFEVAPIEDGQGGEVTLPNYGVYLIGGRAAGFYTRLSQKATNYASVTAPTFISQ